jgi:hypothetical protein
MSLCVYSQPYKSPYEVCGVICPILTKAALCAQILVKLPNVKFHETAFRSFWVVLCEDEKVTGWRILYRLHRNDLYSYRNLFRTMGRGTTSEISDNILHWSKLILSLICMYTMIFQLLPYILEQMGFPLSQTTCLTEFFVNGWLIRWNHNKFHSISALHPFLKFGFVTSQNTFFSVQRCRHFHDCNTLVSTSLQLHIYYYYLFNCKWVLTRWQ